MSWVDIGVLALLAISALIGLARGFARESLGLAAWVGAGLLAARLGQTLVPFARRQIDDQAVADPLAYLAVFLVLLVLFLLVAAAIGQLVRASPLVGLDRLAGLVFGLARGAVLLVIAAMLGSAVWPVSSWPNALTRSQSLPYVRTAASFVSARLPPGWRPDVALSKPDDFLGPAAGAAKP